MWQLDGVRNRRFQVVPDGGGRALREVNGGWVGVFGGLYSTGDHALVKCVPDGDHPERSLYMNMTVLRHRLPVAGMAPAPNRVLVSANSWNMMYSAQPADLALSGLAVRLGRPRASDSPSPGEYQLFDDGNRTVDELFALHLARVCAEEDQGWLPAQLRKTYVRDLYVGLTNLVLPRTSAADRYTAGGGPHIDPQA